MPHEADELPWLTLLASPLSSCLRYRSRSHSCASRTHPPL